MHDLVKEHARAWLYPVVVPETERDAREPVRRLLAYYLYGTSAAQASLFPADNRRRVIARPDLLVPDLMRKSAPAYG